MERKEEICRFNAIVSSVRINNNNYYCIIIPIVPLYYYVYYTAVRWVKKKDTTGEI